MIFKKKTLKPFSLLRGPTAHLLPPLSPLPLPPFASPPTRRGVGGGGKPDRGPPAPLFFPPRPPRGNPARGPRPTGLKNPPLTPPLFFFQFLKGGFFPQIRRGPLITTPLPPVFPPFPKPLFKPPPHSSAFAPFFLSPIWGFPLFPQPGPPFSPPPPPPLPCSRPRQPPPFRFFAAPTPFLPPPTGPIFFVFRPPPPLPPWGSRGPLPLSLSSPRGPATVGPGGTMGGGGPPPQNPGAGWPVVPRGLATKADVGPTR